MAALLQPLANKRVIGADCEEPYSSGNKGGIEHGALLLESVKIVSSA